LLWRSLLIPHIQYHAKTNLAKVSVMARVRVRVAVSIRVSR